MFRSKNTLILAALIALQGPAYCLDGTDAFDHVGTVHRPEGTSELCNLFVPDALDGTYYVGDLEGYESGDRVHVIGDLQDSPDCVHMPSVCTTFTACVANAYVSSLVGGAYCDALINSTGEEASIHGEGNTSLSANRLTLVAESVPSFEPGIFFAGTTQAAIPFGNGIRCVGSVGGLHRLFPYAQANAAGTMAFEVDLAEGPLAAHVEPGSTWYFQAWFRDPLGGGLGFNLSDGLAVTFSS